jgi:hypothetical protein
LLQATANNRIAAYAALLVVLIRSPSLHSDDGREDLSRA